MHGHLRRTLFVYAHPDSRRHADFHDYAGVVGVSARTRRGGTTSSVLGLYAGRHPRLGTTSKEPRRACVSNRRCRDLSIPDQTILLAAHLAAIAAHQRSLHHAAHRCAVAHPGHAKKSSLLLVFSSQRAGRIPWFPLVLFHQRAAFALPESALPARLQHRPPPVVLAVSLPVAVSLERLFPRCRETFLQAVGPRGPSTIARSLLDRLHPRFLHILDDAGILLDALLPGLGAAARFRDGDWRRLDSSRNAGSVRHSASRGNHDLRDFCCCPPCTRSR